MAVNIYYTITQFHCDGSEYLLHNHSVRVFIYFNFQISLYMFLLAMFNITVTMKIVSRNIVLHIFTRIQYIVTPIHVEWIACS